MFEDPGRICYGASVDLEALIRWHLFVICPNNSGSTFLKNALAHSEHTWNLRHEGANTYGFVGPSPRSLGRPLDWASDCETVNKLASKDNYDWQLTRRYWYFQSYSSSHVASVFVVKSPTFLLCVDDLEAAFGNARFIFMVRNPYAIAEGIIRRNQLNRIPEHIMIRRSARHIVRCFQFQKENILRFGAKNAFFTYETMCARPESAAAIISEMIPDLSDLWFRQRLAVKGIYNEILRDMNQQQIDRLKVHEIRVLNEVFLEHQGLFNTFGYELLK